jgi:hypothetical protein
MGFPTLAVSELPLGSLGTKSHLDVGYVERHRVYYKGEGGGFPQVRAVVSLVHPCCPWLILAPRVILLCTNHLVWVGCRLVWVSETCQLFLVPSRSSNMPFYPSKCCELGSVPDSALFRCLLLGLTFESLKESGVRHLQSFYRPPPNSKCEKPINFFLKMKPLLNNAFLSTLEFKNAFKCSGKQSMCHQSCCRLIANGFIG